MKNSEFPRLCQLRDKLPKLPSNNAYNFDVQDNAIKLKHFRDIEAELQGLDSRSWDQLKTDLVPLLTTRDPERGWQALFDKLNEAKGYNYLLRIGCRDVEFVLRSSAKGQKTPDLQGNLGATRVLCEVKTINISGDEAAHRRNSSVRSVSLTLPLGFFNKLKCDLVTARNQMDAYYPGADAKKLAYVVINYDDLLHEYAADYSKQIDQFIATKPVSDLEVFLEAKPAFYSATA
jgi:hypothetical protein